MCTETTNWQMLYDVDGPDNPTFQIGFNPYPVQRITDALEEHDFEELAKRGFTHVRIPIDPWALGMLESPGLGLPPTYQVDTTGRQVLDALVDDIEDAWKNGVWTIVDFHPVVNARGHWNLFYNQTMGPTPLLSATDPAPNDYPGVYKWHFFQKGTATTPSPLTQAWTSIMESFSEIEHPVVFEILNEPLDSEWDRNDDASLWGLDGAGDIGDTTPVIFNHAYPTTWMNKARENWKDITLETVRAIEAKNRYVIVSPITETATDFKVTNSPPFLAYDYGDCELPANLIYSCHFYVPGDFTQHLKDYATNWYDKGRDFLALCAPVYSDTPMGAKFGFVQQWYNQNRSNLEGDHLPLHIMFTEFGAIRDNMTRIGGPIRVGSVPTTVGSCSGTTSPEYPSFMTMYSAKWIYDARKGIEAEPEFGWTYFNVLGGFGAYDGSLNNAGWGNHGNWLGLDTQVRDALFAP